jgi:hypothetical protein
MYSLSWGAQNRSQKSIRLSIARGWSRNPKLELCGIQLKEKTRPMDQGEGRWRTTKLADTDTQWWYIHRRTASARSKKDDIRRKRKNAAIATVLRLLDKSTHDRTEQSTGANGVLHTAPVCYGGEPMANWNLPHAAVGFFFLWRNGHVHAVLLGAVINVLDTPAGRTHT